MLDKVSQFLSGWALIWTQPTPKFHFVPCHDQWVVQCMNIQCIPDGTGLLWGRRSTLSPITMELKYSRWNDMVARMSFKIGRNGWRFRWIKVDIELIIVESEIHKNMRSSLYHSLFVIFFIYIAKYKGFGVFESDNCKNDIFSQLFVFETSSVFGILHLRVPLCS